MMRFAIALVIALFGATAAHAQCATAYPKATLNAQVATDFPDNITGLITPSILRTFQNNLIQSVQSFPGVNSQGGGTYTVNVSDYGLLDLFVNSTAVAVSLPPASATGFCPFAFYVAKSNPGTVTVTPQSGTIGGNPFLLVPPGTSAMLFSDGTNWQALQFGTGGGGGSIISAATNSIGYYATTGTTISGLAPAASSVLVTNGAGTPSVTNTLPFSLTIPSPIFTGSVTGPDLGNWSSSGLSALNLSTTGTVAFGILSPTSLAGSPTTVTGLTTNNSPNTSNDYIPYFNASSNSIERATVGAIAAAATAGVSSLNGLTGGLSIAAGNNIGVSASGTTVSVATAGNVATLNTADQTLSGGVNVTSNNLGTISTGTTTVDCGQSPLQYFSNNGAFTLAAPAADGSCILLDTNAASAGVISFSGFTVSANTGDALTTTNTNKFFITIARINGVSSYLIKALQ